jgi:uncharacterized protein
MNIAPAYASRRYRGSTFPGPRITLRRVSDDHLARFEGLPRRELSGGLTLLEASSGRARRKGLARMDEPPGDHALLIPRCPAVHTFGMRFALDLIWLGKDGRPVRIDRNVRPMRMRACARARSVVETVAGQGDSFVAALESSGRG